MKTARILVAAAAVLAVAACQADPTAPAAPEALTPVFDGGQMMGSGGRSGTDGGTTSGTEGGSTTPVDSACPLCGGQMGGSGG